MTSKRNLNDRSRKTSQRIVFALPLLALVVASVSVGLQFHQDDLDHRLIEAIKLRQTDQAIPLLNQGASANAHDVPNMPVTFKTLLSDFRDRLNGRGMRKEAHPSALSLACDKAGYTDSSGQWVVAHSDITLIRALLSHHANPNTLALWAVRLHEDTSLLDSGIMEGHTDLVELLLENGARQNRSSSPSTTSLFLAIQNEVPPVLTASKRLAIARLLLEHGADVRAKDKNGDTFLHTVASSSKKEIPMLHLLLSFGADVNAQDNQGWTPLIQAANKEGTDNMRFLLWHGADPSIRSKYGETALERVKCREDSSNKRATTRLLIEAVAARGRRR